MIAAFGGSSREDLVRDLETVADDDVHLIDVDEDGFEVLIQNVGSRVEYPTTVPEVVEVVEDILQTLIEMAQLGEAQSGSD